MDVRSVIVIGSGFGGQCAAINLLKRGITDFVILERRDFMGGTWCQNRYPGAAVDVPSPLYSISHVPYQWTQMFAGQDELDRYTHHVIDRYGLRSRTELGANVVGVHWDEPRQCWEVRTERRGVFRGRILINASGPLSTPVIPDFPGRERFRGKSFHTNDWDPGCDYAGKRVAVIGSGASAAQVIPAIAPHVQCLHVFQRTPHWVLPRPDRRFSRIERALLGIRPFYSMLRGLIYWALEWRVIGFKYSRWLLRHVAQRKAERFLRRQVADPELRARLMPDYTIGCKRVILSSTLYPALARDNVRLHTREQGIREIDDAGIVTRDGERIALDLIVYATGYDATDGAVSYPIIGKGGRALADFWREYPRAYLGTAVPGFPNLFIVIGPNTGIGHTSAIFIIESQMNYIMDSIVALKRRRCRAIEVKPEIEDRYTRRIHAEMGRTVWMSGGCRSWYQSRSGHVIAMYPGFSFTYRLLTRVFRPDHHVYS